MVDEIYAVRLTGDDIKRSSTVTDVYNIVAEKANS
jgi:acyl carrier protein